MVDIIGQASRRVDVDNSKLPEYARPRTDIQYMNLNHYTEPDVTQAMRDDVSKWYTRRQAPGFLCPDPVGRQAE